MIGRLVHKSDFQRLLGAPTASRSAHFAVHYVHGRPTVPGRRLKSSGPDELSTADPLKGPENVDNLPVEGCWLGVVVPKRHARRSVTRNVMRRLAREAWSQQIAMPQGLWLVRLRQPFAKTAFPSADSEALRQAVREELAVCLKRLPR